MMVYVRKSAAWYSQALANLKPLGHTVVPIDALYDFKVEDYTICVLEASKVTSTSLKLKFQQVKI